MQWLIDPDALHEIAAQARAMGRPTDAQLRAFVESADAQLAPPIETAAPPRGMSVAGSEAEISIDGPLVPRAMRFFSFLGGGASYDDLVTALAFASREPAIKRVTLRINSPGGTVAGLFDALSALQAFSKPLVARVVTAQSAAYAIAAMADSIEATSKASTFGSIGVVQSFHFWADEEIVHVTNSGSPNKRPDPRTPEGRAAIQRDLDAINDLFVESIALGRSKIAGVKIKASEVTERFGAGSSFLAAEAKARGMVDRLPPREPAPARQRAFNEDDPRPAAADGDKPAADSGTEANEMDLNELKTKHPEVYRAALAAGHEAGVVAERDRVLGHLTMGTRFDALDIMVPAIREGKAMTAELQAEYLTTPQRKAEIAARSADTSEAQDSTAGAAPPNASGAASPASGTGTPDRGDALVASLEADGW